MVGIGALTPAQSFAAIDHDTILLLFAMMLLIAYGGRPGAGLLVFFCGLFIVVPALANTGLVDLAWAQAASPQLDTPARLAGFTGLVAAGSNLVSNVPMVLLAGPQVGQFADPTLAWVALGLATTVAGNLTLLGSVANLHRRRAGAPSPRARLLRVPALRSRLDPGNPPSHCRDLVVRDATARELNDMSSGTGARARPA